MILTDADIARAMLAVDDPLLWGRLGEGAGSSDMIRKFARAVESAVLERLVPVALRQAEVSYSGMLYGDEKRGGPSNYTRGWRDCLAAVKGGFAALPQAEPPTSEGM